jgi:hypothetical protein
MVKTVKRSVNALPVVVYSQLWRMIVALSSFEVLRFGFGPVGHRHGRNDPRLSSGRRVLNQDPAVIAIKLLAFTLLRVPLGDMYLLWPLMAFRTALGTCEARANALIRGANR